jgi:cell division protein ZapA (FtsZ GTPase activity inhibitor)
MNRIATIRVGVVIALMLLEDLDAKDEKEKWRSLGQEWGVAFAVV